MTAIENLCALKLQLEQQLQASPSAEEREGIEGELLKIDIALSFLNDVAEQSLRPAYLEIIASCARLLRSTPVCSAPLRLHSRGKVANEPTYPHPGRVRWARAADSSIFRLCQCDRGMTMLNKESKKERAQTARDLAAISNDPFTKKRLLDLAALYEDNRPPTMVTPVDLGIRSHRMGSER